MLRMMGSTRFLVEVADESSKCIQHDFPRLCGEKTTGQCNMSATAEFLSLPLIQELLAKERVITTGKLPQNN